jgi:hypothetical protein
MSPEYKIDLSKYNGPMTVVGYPDLSAVNPTLETRVMPDETLNKDSKIENHHKEKYPHHRRNHG